MKKLIVLVALLAFVPILVPANADASRCASASAGWKGRSTACGEFP
jgi:hypothetical protein